MKDIIVLLLVLVPLALVVNLLGIPTPFEHGRAALEGLR